MSKALNVCGVVASALATASVSHAQGLEWVKDNYTKREAYVPMRRRGLFTATYTPKARGGFVVVYQDVRGRWMSEGSPSTCGPTRPETQQPRRDVGHFDLELTKLSEAWMSLERMLV